MADIALKEALLGDSAYATRGSATGKAAMPARANQQDVAMPKAIGSADLEQTAVDTIRQTVPRDPEFRCPGQAGDLQADRFTCSGMVEDVVARFVRNKHRGVECRATFGQVSALPQAWAICNSLVAQISDAGVGDTATADLLTPASWRHGTVPIATTAAVEFEIQVPFRFYEVPGLINWGGRMFVGHVRRSPMIMVEPLRWKLGTHAMVDGDTQYEEDEDYIEVVRPLTDGGTPVDCHIEIPKTDASRKTFERLTADAVRVCKSLRVRPLD